MVRSPTDLLDGRAEEVGAFRQHMDGALKNGPAAWVSDGEAANRRGAIMPCFCLLTLGWFGHGHFGHPLDW